MSVVSGSRTLAKDGRIGRYIVHGEIASGGMATVYLASLTGSVGFSRTVALKRLHPQFAKDADFVAMFIDEARIASHIHHPSVVATLDTLTEGDELLVVMEYVHGESVARLMTTDGVRRPIPIPLAAAMVHGVLCGLHAAHEARDHEGRSLGLVDRDVSPQNVLVGVDGAARITDFGIAKAESRMQSTREGQLKGKIGYMAAEQIAERAVDWRTDVFAASVVFWEMLAGKRLFGGVDAAAVLRRILDGKVVPPSVENPAIRPELDAVVLCGLASDPNQRFPSALAMAEAICAVEPLASASELGAWVAEHAAGALAEREALLRVANERPAKRIDEPTAVNAPVGTPPVVVPLPPASPPMTASHKLAIGVATGVAVCGAAAAILWPRPAPPTALTARLASVVLTSAPVSPDPPLAQEPAVSPAPSGANSLAAPSPPAARRSPARTPRKGCQPPVTIGPDGVHRWKPECL